MNHLEKSSQTAVIRQIILWSWLALAVASLYQYLIWESVPNMTGVGFVLAAWVFICRFYMNPVMIGKYPMSMLVLIGFAATQFYFPLIFTSLEGKALVFNLEMPVAVFFHSFAALMVMIFAHLVYRSLDKGTMLGSKNFAVKVGLFNPPSMIQIWIMGVIGLLATAYVWLFAPSIAGAVTGSAGDKFIQGLIPFSYAPFFIPFAKMYGGKSPALKSIAVPLLVFSLALFLISLARNSRGGFMIGFSSVAFAYALGILLGLFKTKLFTLRNSVLAVLTVWLFTGPIADIGTAMVLVRSNRNDISYSELINQTLVAYGDKAAIETYRKNDLLSKDNANSEWNEVYLDNPILARFSNLKFNDISLVQASRIPENSVQMRKFAIDYSWATLPQPFLDALGLNIDKTMLKGISFGDYLYHTAGASEEILGGYRTGHMNGVGMAAFGWYYLLILAIGIVPVFFLFDKFFVYTTVLKNGVWKQHIQFSLCGMLVLDGTFRFLPAESVTYTLVFLMRDWIQIVILYLVVLYLTRLLSTIINMVIPKRELFPSVN